MSASVRTDAAGRDRHTKRLQGRCLWLSPEALLRRVRLSLNGNLRCSSASLQLIRARTDSQSGKNEYQQEKQRDYNKSVLKAEFWWRICRIFSEVIPAIATYFGFAVDSFRAMWAFSNVAQNRLPPK